MPKATEFSDRATADRGWVSGNTNGYKVQASIIYCCVGSGYQFLGKSHNHANRSQCDVNLEGLAVGFYAIW